ncbi:MAG: CRISPR-associated protein Cas4 [Candidatus Wallbacteria bacterium]|nr:CRISPR-associated protein Cas4 [Candidatus Wallbacteria bacterium]
MTESNDNLNKSGTCKVPNSAVEAALEAHFEAAGKTWLTPSDVLEYLYCPRFLYYERVLHVRQHQELRAKVVYGRELHKRRERENVAYLQKKLGVVRKEVDVELHSADLGLSGRVDEVLFLSTGDAAPLDYKFAELTGRVYENLRVQSVLYALMIAERYGCNVGRGFLVYERSQHHIEELTYTLADFASARDILDRMRDVLMRAVYPGSTRWRERCKDCCYRNICPK